MRWHGTPRFGGSDHDPYGFSGGRMKMSSPFGRVIQTLAATAFLVLVLMIAVQGSFQTRSQIADTFSRQESIQKAQVALEELLRL